MKTLQNNIKLIIGVFVLAVLAVSCVPKTETMGNAGQTLVKLSPEGFSVVALNPTSSSQTLALLEVRRDVPSQAALDKPTTAVLTFDADTSILDAYNTENETEFIPLPTSLHSTTPALVGGKITLEFAAGEYVKSVMITVPNAFNFDFSKQYALTYTLSSVTGEGTISQAVSTDIIVQVLAKNKYDGIYEVTAITPMVDYANAALVGNYPFKYKLITTGENTCDCFDFDNDYPLHSILNGGSWSYYGSFGPQVVFKADGSGTIVSMTNYWGNPAGNTRGCLLDDSQTWGWDPATKSIRVKYYMTQPSVITTAPYIRTAFDEKWTYKGSR